MCTKSVCLETKSCFPQVAAALEDKFQERITIVESLKNTVEEEYDKFLIESSFDECCTVAVNEEDEQFKVEVLQAAIYIPDPTTSLSNVVF